jgi:GNAT superfamily N-acetyltransferase
MPEVAIVSSKNELEQIFRLNWMNLKQNLSSKEQMQEGFVTWLYSIELLEQMHRLAPSIIVKDNGEVIAYALTTLKESRVFHPDLNAMFQNLQQVHYKDKPLSSYDFYCMGQICVAKKYRGKGLAKALYQKHKEVYGNEYDFILTEISTRNFPSLKAHQNIGFETIYTHRDEVDEWNVVVWNWK